MAAGPWVAVLALGLALVGGCAHGVVGAGRGEFAAKVVYTREGVAGNRLVLLGETHGTRETPDLVAELVTAYADDGPVLVGLDIARREQAAISRYLDSDGDTTARTALRAGPFWQVSDDRNDGRRTHDMLDLIEAVRVLRSRGRNVALLAYDIDPGDVGSTCEQRMAARLRAGHASQHGDGRMVVLAGNVHAMLKRPDDAPAEMPRPMGAYLADLMPYSVRIDAAGGQWWGCVPGSAGERVCGPRPVAPAPSEGVPTGIFVRSYHRQVVLPRFTLAQLTGSSQAR